METGCRCTLVTQFEQVKEEEKLENSSEAGGTSYTPTSSSIYEVYNSTSLLVYRKLFYGGLHIVGSMGERPHEKAFVDVSV